MIFNFYTPQEDVAGRSILCCQCQSDYGRIDCNITYAALGKLTASDLEGFTEAASAFRRFSQVIRQLWVQRILERRRLSSEAVCLDTDDFPAVST